jgi:hypothetical protein
VMKREGNILSSPPHSVIFKSSVRQRPSSRAGRKCLHGCSAHRQEHRLMSIEFAKSLVG